MIVTLGDLKGEKHAKFGREICFYLKIDQTETEFSEDNHSNINIMCERIQTRTLIAQFFSKMSIFQEKKAPKFHKVT